MLAELLGAVAPAAAPAGWRARVLARVQTETAPFTLRAAAGSWRALMPGVEVKPLRYDAPTRTVSFLLRLQPGTTVPEHGHRACEECLVLAGSFTIGSLTLHAGDYHAAPAETRHATAHTETGALVYLRASADDYPLACP